jgi:hypothetical protein
MICIYGKCYVAQNAVPKAMTIAEIQEASEKDKTVCKIRECIEKNNCIYGKTHSVKIHVKSLNSPIHT